MLTPETNRQVKPCSFILYTKRIFCDLSFTLTNIVQSNYFSFCLKGPIGHLKVLLLLFSKDLAGAFALCGRERGWPMKFTALLEQQWVGLCPPNLGRP